MLSALLAACSSTRQIAVDFPSAADPETGLAATSKAHPFQPITEFQYIDGDDYYLRLISEFDFKGDNLVKSGCQNRTPSYEKTDQTSALIFSISNEKLKFSHDAAGFSYQSSTGKCNFKFDAKKLILTPWMRLDTGKETTVDYSFYSTGNSDVDVSGLLGDVTTAGSLLSFTGVGMGVAILGQYAGQWAQNNQQTQVKTPNAVSAKNSSESHSLSAIVAYSGKSGVLNQTVFKVYAVEEGGMHLLGSDTQPLGELKIYPELMTSLLLKTNAEGVPDARDLTFEEIGSSPIKSASGEIQLLQLFEQSKHAAKPNLKPTWTDYNEVESSCRKIKLFMRDLGFNKFDRNAFIYYFLTNNTDWLNYNISRKKAVSGDLSFKAMAGYRSKDFGNCLNSDDYTVMKAMGLPVNTPADWDLMGESSQKKEQSFVPMKSIERQLLAVLKNPSVMGMERQLYPLLSTAKSGNGTVLLQNRLGDFGLEKMLTTAAVSPKEQTAVEPAGNSTPANTSVSGSVEAAKIAAQPVVSTAPASVNIPGEGLIISARQLAQVFSGLLIDELSCARPAPQWSGNQIGNEGILLFTTKAGSPRAKGGAMEFEFSAGKINRIAFQLSTFRDFEQDLLDRPEIGGCRIDPGFVVKLH